MQINLHNNVASLVKVAEVVLLKGILESFIFTSMKLSYKRREENLQLRYTKAVCLSLPF